MPLPQWPDPVHDNKNNNSSVPLNFQPRKDLMGSRQKLGLPRSRKQTIESKPWLNKAEVTIIKSKPLLNTILPGQDHLAASVYGDAKKVRCDPEQKTAAAVTKELNTSGYDFGEMLKGQDFNVSWGASSNSGSWRCDPERRQETAAAAVTKKLNTSGYDFGEMLKGQDFNVSWGASSNSGNW
jgi:hypothetical protein